MVVCSEGVKEPGFRNLLRQAACFVALNIICGREKQTAQKDPTRKNKQRRNGNPHAQAWHEKPEERPKPSEVLRMLQEIQARRGQQ